MLHEDACYVGFSIQDWDQDQDWDEECGYLRYISYQKRRAKELIRDDDYDYDYDEPARHSFYEEY